MIDIVTSINILGEFFFKYIYFITNATFFVGMQGVVNYRFLASKISADYTTRLEVFTREMKIDLDEAKREVQKKMESNVEVHVVDDEVKIEVIVMTDLLVDQLKAVNKALGIFYHQN